MHPILRKRLPLIWAPMLAVVGLPFLLGTVMRLAFAFGNDNLAHWAWEMIHRYLSPVGFLVMALDRFDSVPGGPGFLLIAGTGAFYALLIRAGHFALRHFGKPLDRHSRPVATAMQAEAPLPTPKSPPSGRGAGR
jgi:hypothetical protein